MNLFKPALLAVALITAAAGNVQAAETSATFQVKIKIVESCDITTTKPTDIDFGQHTRATAAVNLTQTGTITVNCSAGTPYQIGLNGGIHSTGDAAAPIAGQRRMAGASSFVAYDLYQDAGTTFWGNTAGNRVGDTGTGAAQAHTVTGKVTSINVPAGDYVDTVTATVVY